MNGMRVRLITRTAVLLSIAIIFQMLGRLMGPNNNFIVGPLVNACLIISAASTGLWGGTAISIIAPFVSALTNKAAIAPIVLAFSPFIAAGNFILVLSYFLLAGKNKIVGIAVGAALKFVFLLISITMFANIFKIAPAPAKVLINLFSWPQLVTALAGGIVALAVIKALGKSIEL